MALKMTVRNMITSAVAALKIKSSTFNSFAGNLTEREILCVIAANRSDAFYDYYELATFRAASPCSGIAKSVVQLAVQKAANMTGKYMYTSKTNRQHGRHEGAGDGANAPLQFENDDVICCFPVKYNKFSIAPAVHALNFS